jgi:hypothetical protein
MFVWDGSGWDVFLGTVASLGNYVWIFSEMETPGTFFGYIKTQSFENGDAWYFMYHKK